MHYSCLFSTHPFAPPSHPLFGAPLAHPLHPSSHTPCIPLHTPLAFLYTQVTPTVLKNIIGQTLFQLGVMYWMVVYSPAVLGYPDGGTLPGATVHYTMVFNTFVMMQLFNQVCVVLMQYVWHGMRCICACVCMYLSILIYIYVRVCVEDNDNHLHDDIILVKHYHVGQTSGQRTQAPG